MALSWESVKTHNRSSKMKNSLDASTLQSFIWKEPWRIKPIVSNESLLNYGKVKPMKTAKHTLRFRAMRMRPWLVMRRKGVLPRSWSSLSMASASIRRLCQLISLNVNTWIINNHSKLSKSSKCQFQKMNVQRLQVVEVERGRTSPLLGSVMRV